MTRQQHNVRAAIIVTGATLFVLALSAQPASAEYRAWYAPGDYFGYFEAGDVSEDETKMIPPVGACGLRLISPNSFRWADGDGNDVEDDENDNPGVFENLDVIIWVDAPNCWHSFSVEQLGGPDPELPDAGAAYLEIYGSDGAYWVNNDGCHVNGCGGVEPGADDEATAPSDYWSLAAVSAFKAVTAGVIDPPRQPRAITAVATLSREAARLPTLLQKQIADRRRSPLGVLEASVRGLEDAATRSLSAARASVATCETRVRQRAYTDAFVACTTAGQQVEHSGSLMHAAWSLAQPAR